MTDEDVDWYHQKRIHKLCNKALTLCGLHKFKKSLKCVDKILELNPKLAIAWNLKGLVYNIWGKTLEDQIDRRYRFGEIEEKRLEHSIQKNKESLKCYDKAIKLNPKYLMALYDKAIILVRLGRASEVMSMENKFSRYIGIDCVDMFQQSLECCDKVLALGQTSWELEDTTQLNPTRTEERGIDLDIMDNYGWDQNKLAQRTFFTKGKILHFHMSKHQPTDFEYLFDDQNPDAWDEEVIQVEQAFKKITNYLEEAVKCYRNATKINYEYLEAWYNMGLVLLLLNKGEEALESFAEVIEIDPKNVDILDGLGDALVFLEQYNESIKCFKKLVKLDPENSIAWNKLGLIHQYMENIPESIKCFRKSTKLDPEDPTAWDNMGDSFRSDKGDAENNEAKAGSCYLKAEEIDPAFYVRMPDFASLGDLFGKINEQKKEKIVRKWKQFKKQKEEYEKKKLEIRLSKDEVKISEICQNCSLAKNVLKVALDIYRNVDEMFEEYSWSTYPKGFSGIGAPRRSSEVKETRKTEMLKRPPFAAAVVYMACKQCDVTSSIEKILQKICRPKKIKSNAIQDAEKYYSTLLKNRLNSWRFARY